MNLKFLATAVIALTSAATTHATDRAQTSIDNFIARKAVQEERRLDILSRLGKANDYAYLLACADTLNLEPPGYPTLDVARQAALKTTFQADVVGTLVTAGMPIQECNSKELRDSFKTATRVIRGEASIPDLLSVSDFAVKVVASPAALSGYSSAATDGDGYRSSLGFVVTESLSGDLKPGEKLIVRQQSGRNSDGSVTRLSTDPEVKNGSKYIIIGSRNDYQVAALENGSSGATARVKRSSIAIAYLIASPDSLEGMETLRASSQAPYRSHK